MTEEWNNDFYELGSAWAWGGGEIVVGCDQCMLRIWMHICTKVYYYVQFVNSFTTKNVKKETQENSYL